MTSKNRREIGDWGPVKNEIIVAYAKEYTKILSKRPWFKTLYVDVFAGSPENTLRSTGELVDGSAKRALSIDPPFSRYLFVDMDQTKVVDLELMSEGRDDVDVVHGDANSVLRDRVLPLLERSRDHRALILLDPYGVDLEWDVMYRAGQTKRAEVILNFPIMAINRSALHRRPGKVLPVSEKRMIRLWGSDSWREEFYRQPPQLSLGLFNEEPADEKSVGDQEVVEAYARRLQEVAGFSTVATPLAIRSPTGGRLYYLVFAAHKPVAMKIMSHILDKRREVRHGKRIPH